MNRRLTRIALAASLAIAGSVVLASAASATYDLNKIREITGDTAGGNQSYIELQMYASGQNQVAGHNITVWDEDALVLGTAQPIQTHTLTGPNPPNGDSQRTILIADTAVTNADFTIPELSNYLESQPGADLTEGGAICFEAIPIDCVAWGQNFSGANNLPDKTTPNGSNMPTGLLALQRNIGGGTCPTALDAADDTNNAGADFSLVGANPRPNSVTPTETLCSQTGGGGTGGGGTGGGGTGGGGTGGPGPVAPGQPAPTCKGKQTTILGTDGPDQFAGTAAADVISALGGNDTVTALGGKDVVCGGPGKDTLKGGKGKDTLLGQKGKDKLKGGPGKDLCKGGKGDDTASKCEVEKSI